MGDSRNRGPWSQRTDRIEVLVKKQVSVCVQVKLNLESKLNGGEMYVIKAEMSATRPQTTDRLMADH